MGPTTITTLSTGAKAGYLFVGLADGAYLVYWLKALGIAGWG